MLTVSATESASLVTLVCPSSVLPAVTLMDRALLPVSLLLTVSAGQSPLLLTDVCVAGRGRGRQGVWEVSRPTSMRARTHASGG